MDTSRSSTWVALWPFLAAACLVGCVVVSDAEKQLACATAGAGGESGAGGSPGGGVAGSGGAMAGSGGSGGAVMPDGGALPPADGPPSGACPVQTGLTLSVHIIM